MSSSSFNVVDPRHSWSQLVYGFQRFYCGSVGKLVWLVSARLQEAAAILFRSPPSRYAGSPIVTKIRYPQYLLHINAIAVSNTMMPSSHPDELQFTPTALLADHCLVDIRRQQQS
jgi:hypothetical protein